MEIDKDLLYKKCSGIYSLFLEDVLVYVGISTNMYQRIQEHAISGKKFDNIKHVEIKIEQCPEVEINLITLLKPPLNKSTTIYRNNRRKEQSQLRINSIYVCSYCGKKYESVYPKIYHNNACKQKAYRDRRESVERTNYETN